MSDPTGSSETERGSRARDHLANERTFLAWLRTAATVMVLGLGVARCTRGDSLPRPKIQRPMKVDSRKKAARPSMASGAPKTSPTYRE